MTMGDPIPTAADVIAYLNDRLAARGAARRVDHLDVLPYVNPMWLANWRAPQLDGIAELEDEVREARWRFPQIL
jgi:hypothetical protein